MEKKFLIIIFFFSFSFNFSQNNIDNLIFEIISKVSEDNLKKDIISLANFGTRHTLSDTLSKDRGIGAARRWIKNTFEQISNSCNNCIEVFYQKNYFKRNNLRLVKDVWINNVVAVQKGYKYPNRYVIMSGDIDSRVSDPNDYMSDSPGANDNATGMAGTIEAARVLSKYKFENSIIYLGLSGEEQGLYGGQGFAEFAKKNNWEIIGVLNNDMIGNIEGVNGTIDNRSFRIFSEPVPANETDRERYMRRFYGGEVDGNSRQLARFIYNSTKKYMPEMKPNIIYRLDRFGRGGHHRPFNDLGFAGVRIMESNENYNRQHQDLRVENGIKFGDVIDGVDFNYVKKLTTVNIVNLILIGSSPPPPKNLSIGGIVEPSVKFKWDENNDKNIKGYKIYWRETSSPHWQFSRYIGKLNKYTLDGIIIDNYLFSVTTVSNNGYESIFEFPSETFRN
ncbi:MAG: peptidase M28 [Cryomorphaceae bacterium]|nr:MAG: peptidase M28 [Cryomorphaceae bacterium]